MSATWSSFGGAPICKVVRIGCDGKGDGGGTYATVYAEHVAAGKVDLAGIAGTCQVC